MSEEEKTKVRKRAINNKRKGHNMERDLVKIFKKLGFPFTKTSRSSSRLLDNCKVDLAFVPYNIQSKKVESTIKYQNVFEEMEINLKENFPRNDPQINYPKIIFHRRGMKKTQKFVVMMEHEFIELLSKVNKDCNLYE